MTVQINNSISSQQFLVVQNISPQVILGTDYLSQTGATLVFKDSTFMLCQETSEPMSDSVRVSVANQTIVPPHHLCMLQVTCSVSVQELGSSAYFIEGVQKFKDKHPDLDVGEVIVSGDQMSVFTIPVANLGGTDKTLYAGTNVAAAELLSNVGIEENTQEEASCGCAEHDDVESKHSQQELLEYVERQSHLSAAQKQRLGQLLIEFRDIFVLSGDTLGLCSVCPHRIKTGDAAPIKQAARRLPFHKRATLKTLLEDLLSKGVISESDSPWASPIVLVDKKDGSSRLCVDYRKLNKMTTPDAYPLPRIDDTLDSLQGCKLFSTMDLASGYFQLELEEVDREKSAFATPIGLYQFNVLPMGVCNGPATFQRAMEKVLSDLLLTNKSEICRVFFDDVNVASIEEDGHFSMLQNVFTRFRNANLKLKLKKCHFLQKQVTFLGHCVSEDGVSTMADKVAKVQNWPTPTNVRDLQAFLGLAGYYRRFIKNFSEVAAPLHAVTATNSFHWTKSCVAAFRILKERLTMAPILAYPDLNADADSFILDTDASQCGMGAVLSQKQDGRLKVIAYASKLFNKAQKNYSTYDRELLACVTFIDHFRHYLLGKNFELRTDHSALTSLFSSPEPKGRRARWLERLTDYQFNIVHRSGTKHSNADALSRVPSSPAESEEECPQTEDVAVLIPEVMIHPPFDVLTEEEVSVAQLSDPEISTVIAWFDNGSLVRPPEATLVGASRNLRRFAAELGQFVLHAKVLWYKSLDHEHISLRLVVPPSLQELAVASVHLLPGSSHLGIGKTLQHCKDRFYWYGLDKFVKTFIQGCEVCQKTSKRTSSGTAMLQNMQTGYRFERVGVDLIGPLPITDRGNRYILVAVDYFSRWAEAYPLVDTRAETVADVLVREWVCRYGAPHSLHSDQGAQFTSNLFQEMCRVLGVEKTQTTPYHPQGNGLTERFNGTLISFLRPIVQDNVLDWDLKLPQALLSYRSSVHRSLDFTPAMMMFGCELRLPVDIVFGLPETLPTAEATSTYILNLVQNLREVHHSARLKDEAVHQIQKDYFDRKAKGEMFSLGDIVWLLDTVVQCGSGQKKFHSPWKGPYEIIANKHPVYSIKPSLGKPLTVHFNRLKKCHRFKSMPSGRPPDSESASSDSPSPPNLVFVDDDYMPLQPAPLAPRRVQPQRTRQLPGHLRQFNVPLPPQR